MRRRPFTPRGVTARILENGDAPPAVFGQLDAPGATRTVGLYAHYDGQPVNLPEWATPPFQPTLSSAPTDWTVALNYTGGGLAGPLSIAIDGSGNVWVTDGSGVVSELSSNGAAISPSTGYTGGGLDGPTGIAIDGTGNVWMSNYLAPSVSEFSSSGAAISPSSGYTGGGLYDSYGIAVDSSGNIWVTNFDGASVSEFSSSGAAISPSTGYTGGGLKEPYGIAIDGSGNVWVANSRASSVSELAGAAAPVVTPLATAVKNNKLGQRP